MPNAHTFEAYRLLREKLGDEATAALLQYIQELPGTWPTPWRCAVRTRAELMGDIAAVRAEMYQIRDELKGDIAAVREELKGDIAAIRTEMYQIRDELKRDVAQVREEIRGELFRVKMILYVVIALVILSNPKVLDTLGRIVDFLK